MHCFTLPYQKEFESHYVDPEKVIQINIQTTYNSCPLNLKI